MSHLVESGKSALRHERQLEDYVPILDNGGLLRTSYGSRTLEECSATPRFGRGSIALPLTRSVAMANVDGKGQGRGCSDSCAVGSIQDRKQVEQR